MIPDLLKGALIGFLIAVPVGPIGVLCIRRTMAGGKMVGFVSGLGAATADSFYGFMAALSVGWFIHFMVAYREPIQILGGLFMLFLALRMILSPPARPEDQPPPVIGLGAAYWSTLGLTLANPTTILSFLGIFATFGVATAVGSFAAATVVTGVFAGSAAWWLLLAAMASWLAKRLQNGGLHIVNRCGGAIILVFGLWYLLHTLYPKLP